MGRGSNNNRWKPRGKICDPLSGSKTGDRAWRGDEKLKNATLNSLLLVDRNGLKSIAFPAISTGVFGFPKDRFSTIMLSTIVAYLEGYTKLERVIFCLYDKKT
jgi:O-acetyl-ADP-ribose deacetylase (regulator of RNase III)